MSHDRSDSPSAKLEAIEKWSARATLVILGGIALEIAALLIFRHPDMSLCEIGILITADILVGTGLVVEYFCILRTIVTGGELQRESDAKVAQALERASIADQKAAEANERTAEIEKLTGWRHITPEQIEKIKDSIREKVGALDLLIEYERSDPEAYSYAREFAQVFSDVSPLKIRFGPNQYLGLAAFGLYLEKSPLYDATPILDAIRGAGVIVTAAHERDLTGHLWGTDPPNLLIFVAAKPPPPLVTIK